MKFYSTNNKSLRVDFEVAVRQGMAIDGGLFMPEKIEVLPLEFWRTFFDKTFVEVSSEVASHFLKGNLPEEDIRRIVTRALVFDAPIIEVESGVFALELFHGPTLAFKDFGARFLAEVFAYYTARQGEEITILVATSGDTGSAVAQAFFNLPGIKVVVLYPSGKVSEYQEKQFTTLGGNVTALEVDGTFDDCQQLVKKAFGDELLRKHRVLTSANSINIARLLPQMFYYFRAFQQLPTTRWDNVVISVPSGNFGNLTAGLMAWRLGLPIKKFIAATNINDVVPQYLLRGGYSPQPSRSTISNAMDVGNPSNFGRIMDLFHGDHAAISKLVAGYVFTDDETRTAIRKVYQDNGYLLDPHSAVGYLALKKSFLNQPGKNTGIFLATAHPAKFRDVVGKAIDGEVPLPEVLTLFLNKEKQTIRLKNDFAKLKEFLLQ